MKRLSIFVILLLSIIRGVSQESEDDYQYDEETESEEEYQDDEETENEEEDDEGQNNYFDFSIYYDFSSDEYSNVLDKTNDMSSEEEEILYKFVVEVQQNKVLKNRLFRELITKPVKKGPYKDKDSPGFNCIILGLIENKTTYDAIIKGGRSEEQARNAAALSERIIRRKCAIALKKNKE